MFEREKRNHLHIFIPEFKDTLRLSRTWNYFNVLNVCIKADMSVTVETNAGVNVIYPCIVCHAPTLHIHSLPFALGS